MDGSKIPIGRTCIPNWTGAAFDAAARQMRREQEVRRNLYPRHTGAKAHEALEDSPVVMLIGPRQCGKTTLVRDIIGDGRRYSTLDDEAQLQAATADPVGLVRDMDNGVIDEVQSAPALLRAIKRSVDENRRPGRFLLTGSANILTLPKVSESLAGRMSIIRLLPLSQSEILGGRPPSLLDRAFAGARPEAGEPLCGDELVRAVFAGGYPEMLSRSSERRRQAWARDYVDAIVQRDVQAVSDIERLDRMQALLRAIAIHSGQLANLSGIGATVGIDHKTVSKYIGILEQVFLMSRLPAWSGNRMKRLVKAPKLHFLDSGLLAAMLELTEDRIAADRTRFGPLLETFVHGEILKLAGWSDRRITLAHYRDKDQLEVDFVLENGRGEVVGIEVKASATVRETDFRGLKRLADATGPDFKSGLLLYDGENVLPFGDRMFAAPVSALWAP